MSNSFAHAIRQPLTAIRNFSEASRLLLEQLKRSITPANLEEAERVMRWQEQIIEQVVRIDHLLTALEKKELDRG